MIRKLVRLAEFCGNLCGNFVQQKRFRQLVKPFYQLVKSLKLDNLPKKSVRIDKLVKKPLKKLVIVKSVRLDKLVRSVKSFRLDKLVKKLVRFSVTTGTVHGWGYFDSLESLYTGGYRCTYTNKRSFPYNEKMTVDLKPQIPYKTILGVQEYTNCTDDEADVVFSNITTNSIETQTFRALHDNTSRTKDFYALSEDCLVRHPGQNSRPYLTFYGPCFCQAHTVSGTLYHQIVIAYQEYSVLAAHYVAFFKVDSSAYTWLVPQHSRSSCILGKSAFPCTNGTATSACFFSRG